MRRSNTLQSSVIDSFTDFSVAVSATREVLGAVPTAFFRRELRQTNHHTRNPTKQPTTTSATTQITTIAQAGNLSLLTSAGGARSHTTYVGAEPPEDGTFIQLPSLRIAMRLKSLSFAGYESSQFTNSPFPLPLALGIRETADPALFTH